MVAKATQKSMTKVVRRTIASIMSGWVREDVAADYCGVSIRYFRTRIYPLIERQEISNNLVKYKVADLDRWNSGELD